MNKIFILTESLMKSASYLSEKKYIRAIRDGLIAMMPFMLIRSFCVLINNFPLSVVQEFYTTPAGAKMQYVILTIYDGTDKFMALGVLLAISYSLSVRNAPSLKNNSANPVIMAILSLSCLLTITNFENQMEKWTGAAGLFIAVITALLSCSIFCFFYNRRIFKVDYVSDPSDPVLSQAFSSLEPAMMTILSFGIIRFLFYISGVSNIHVFVYSSLKDIFTNLNSSFITAVIFNFSSHLFWFLGLHGNNVLENITVELWEPRVYENIAQAAAGNAPSQIFTKEFFDVFIFMGGSGATLCLIIALMIYNRNSNTARLTKMCVPLSLFNINEPIIYGIPIVFNPFYLIPFIITPIALLTSTYIAMRTGLVPLVISRVEWTTPVIFGGIQATGSWRGAALQIFNIALGTLIYIPFVRMNEKYYAEKNKQIAANLSKEVNYIENNKVPVLLSRADDIGHLSRMLASDLLKDITERSERLYMVYQPLIRTDERVSGAEALVRWEHEKFGFISPPIIVILSEEGKFADKFNEFVFDEAVGALKKLNEADIVDFKMSLNISPSQIHDGNLVSMIERIIKKYDVDPKNVEVEITENIALNVTAEAKKNFTDFRKIGLKLAMDDFGMGHSSLLYIKSFSMDTLKIDGSLTSDVVTNEDSAGIISAITALCKSLNIETVAEYVETENQKDLLKNMGIDIFQGYYYAKPLKFNDIKEFINSFNSNGEK